MGIRFDFAAPQRILFGTGTLAEAATHGRHFGARVLVVTGKTVQRAESFCGQLAKEGVTAVTFSVAGEPTIQHVRAGVQLAHQEQCVWVAGFGGGSALDAAKAIASLLNNEGDPQDYLEVVGRGRALTRPSLPLIAIPTTAGTGTEATRNAVLGVPEQGVKVSLRSPFLLPRLAIIDPALTLELPPDITAITGLDALTQLIEPFVSCRANPLTDGLCREGIKCVAQSLRKVCKNGADLSARENMALASLLSGICLANAGLGAVHGFAAPIGGSFHAPHGAICAALLPHVMAANTQALLHLTQPHPALGKYQEIAGLLTGNPQAGLAEGIQWVQDLCHELGIPRLSNLGIKREDFPEIIQKAQAASSMKANPLALSAKELETILEKAW